MKLTILILIIPMFMLITSGCSRVITSGNHIIKGGTKIPGNLVISSGRIVLEQGSFVDGSVIMTSGDLAVYGEIDGNILMTSGQVYVGPEAVVHGSIRGASGNIQQAEGARVLGGASSDSGQFNVTAFLALVGTAFYFLITGGRRRTIPEKQPIEWEEKSSEKGGYV